jgi:hypothetical protein
MAVFSMFLLSFFAEQQPQSKSNFTRLFPPGLLRQEAVNVLPSSYFYFVGMLNSEIVAANTAAPTRILLFDNKLASSRMVIVSLPEETPRFSLAKIHLDSPSFFMTDGIIPFILTGEVSDWVARRFIDQPPYFLESTIVDKDFVAVRSWNSTVNNSIFGKVTQETENVKFKLDVLPTRKNAIFTSQGQLAYSEELNKLIYVYTYSNQVVQLDTALNVIGQFKTLDSISVPQVKIEETRPGSFTHSAPPVVVNQISKVFGHWLFICSPRQSINEIDEEFKKYSAIDIYDLRDGSYQFSIKLFHHATFRMHDFYLNGSDLFVIYHNYILKYRMNTELLTGNNHQ